MGRMVLRRHRCYYLRRTMTRGELHLLLFLLLLRYLPRRRIHLQPALVPRGKVQHSHNPLNPLSRLVQVLSRYPKELKLLLHPVHPMFQTSPVLSLQNPTLAPTQANPAARQAPLSLCRHHRCRREVKTDQAQTSKRLRSAPCLQ